MKRYSAVFAVLFAILGSILWVLLADRTPSPSSSQHIEEFSINPTPDKARPSVVPTKVSRKDRIIPRLKPIKKPRIKRSESEQMGDQTVTMKETNYPERPEPPEYDMPEGPEIVPFAYQRIVFKNAPEGQRIGLALYITLKDPEKRKIAFAHRTYLHRLTTFLASKYDFGAVQSAEGKRQFIEMLEVRFRRRVKGDLIERLDSAFFEQAP